MADVARVAVEEEEGEGFLEARVGGPDEVRVEGFAVGGGEVVFGVVGDAELGGGGDAGGGAGAHRDGAGVDELAGVGVGGCSRRILFLWGGERKTYFCLK